MQKLRFLILNLFSKKIIQNFSYLFLLQFFSYAFPFLTIPFISRIVSVDLIGYNNYYLAIISYFSLIINFGFDYTGTRLLVGKDKKSNITVSQIFNNVYLVKFILFIICTVIGISLIFIDNKLKDNVQLYLSSLFSIISIFLLPNWFYIAMKEMKYITIFNFVTKIVYFPLVFILLKTSDDFILLNYINSTIQILFSLIAFVLVRKKYSITSYKFSLKQAINYIKVGFPSFISWVVISFYTTFNIIQLAHYCNSESVAYYSNANKILMICMQLILMPLSTVLFPHISEKFHISLYNGVSFINNWTIKISGIITFCCILLFIFSEMIINILYGRQYFNSIELLKILSIIPLFIFISNMYGIQGLLNIKEDKSFFYITIIASIISISLNYFLIPIFNEKGTAIAWLVTEIIVALLMFLTFQYKVKKNEI